MKKSKKTLIAAVLVVAMTVMSGCGKTVDTKNDPLSDYSVDSKLPFASRDPNLTSESPSPSPSPSVSPSAPAQNWQSEQPPVSAVTPTVAPAATSRVYTRLESGAEGEDVLALQNRLIQLGYLTGTADGKYGTQTQNAIKLFQKALGISQTGIANVSLQEKLYASNAPVYTASSATANPNTGSTVTVTGYSTLVRGDSGDNVRNLQNRLKELGYLSGSADGSFGGQTESAVKAFQRALGLTQSGVASSSLQEKLFSSSAPAAAVTVTQAPTARPTQAPTARPSSPTPTPNNTGYSELTYGMKNSLAVQNMQTRLKALGYFTAQCTGNYYSQTSEAVKLFQKAVGLSATGTATVETQILLYASNAPAYSSATATPTSAPTAAPGTYVVLQKGSRGTEVTNLQKRLIALGWTSSAADGIYGNNTVNAVKAFQAAVGYEQTGVASVELQTILFSAVAPYNNAATAAPTGTPIPSSSYQTLKSGDTGEAVKNLQRRLKELGYFNGVIGGNYLTKTTAAVKLFETALGRTPTGEASAELQEILFSASAPAYSDVNVGYTSLARGDSGLQVTNLQKRLIELGWLSGKADGDFGSATEKAVSAFQAAAGLTQSGVADSDTQNMLYSSDAPRYTAPAPVTTDTPAPTQAPTQAPTVTNTPTPSGYQALQPGDSGDLVAAMQRRLKELGYFNGNVVGNYKDLTTAAVKRFQAAMGYEQDGVASSALLDALYSSSAPAYDPSVYGYIGLVSGNTGSAVTAMQQRLIELGWLSGSADGDYGKNTVNAVKAFQSAAGLSATGDADSNTLSVLYSGSAPAYTAPAVTDVPVTEPPVTDAPATEPPAEEGYTVLSNGSSGNAVKRLQQRLIELGWLTGSADGDYGAATAQAVAAFQYQIAQPQDGVAGIELQERLFAADAHAYVEYQDLAEGDTGEAVLAVQMRLIELGYLDNTEANTDGEYGPLLSNAIALLQSNSGALPEDVDGVCDIEFQTFLFSDNALAYSLIDQVG